MGNEQMKQVDDFPDGYRFVSIVNHPPYKDCKIYQNETTKQLIAVMTMNKFPNEILEFRNVSKNLVQFIDWSKEDYHLCGDSHTVSLYYEYCPSNLEVEIERVKANNMLFREEEVWYVLNGTTNMEQDLFSKGLAHTDIRPNNVLITQDDLIKFAPAGLFPHDINGYKKYIYLNDTPYLAPENMSHNIKNIDWQSNDVYSAGLTILDMLTLEFSTENNRTQSRIDERLTKSRANYSSGLCDLVARMLDEQQDRISFKEIQDLLLPYQKQILSLKPFDFPLLDKPKRSLKLVTEVQPQLVQTRVMTPPKVLYLIPKPSPQSETVFLTHSVPHQHHIIQKTLPPIVLQHLHQPPQIQYPPSPQNLRHSSPFYSPQRQSIPIVPPPQLAQVNVSPPTARIPQRNRFPFKYNRSSSQIPIQRQASPINFQPILRHPQPPQSINAPPQQMIAPPQQINAPPQQMIAPPQQMIAPPPQQNLRAYSPPPQRQVIQMLPPKPQQQQIKPVQQLPMPQQQPQRVMAQIPQRVPQQPIAQPPQPIQINPNNQSFYNSPAQNQPTSPIQSLLPLQSQERPNENVYTPQGPYFITPQMGSQQTPAAVPKTNDFSPYNTSPQYNPGSQWPTQAPSDDMSTVDDLTGTLKKAEEAIQQYHRLLYDL